MSRGRLYKKWATADGPEIRRLQGVQLHRYLKRVVIPFSAHYRELFRREGLTADDIRGLDDLHKIPFSSKLDLLNAMEKPEGIRDFVIIPDRKKLARRPALMLKALVEGHRRVRDKLAREFRPVFLTSTTGRSTQPVSFLYSRYDLSNLASAGVRLVDVFGSKPDERLLNVFPFAPHLAFWQTHYATKYAGVFSVGTGGGKVMGTHGNIRLLEKLKANAVIGMPTFLYHMLHEAVAQGSRCDTLKTLVLGGEKAPAGMRRKLAALAEKLGSPNVYVVATYGFTEGKMAWGECPHPVGETPPGYHLYPDLGVIEIIDPETGEVQPEGCPGEIVFTPLDARGSVVLRYRTNDYIDGGIFYEACSYCGRKGVRLVGNISRRSHVKELQFDKIKGTLVDLNDMEHALDDIDQVGAWQVELRKKNDDPMELDEIVLHIQKADSTPDTDLIRIVNQRFSAFTELRPNEIFFHDPRKMRDLQGIGTELKEKKIVDNRPKENEAASPRVEGAGIRNETIGDEPET